MATIEEIIIQLRTNVKDARRNLESVNKTFKKNGELTKTAQANMKKFEQAQSKLSTMTKHSRVQFAGWALSLMFFGMALQRVSNTIWKMGTKTFQDVMHSVQDTVTQFDLLEGSTSFLKFVIGQALEPIAAALIPIVDTISDWVQKNPELLAGIVAWGAALGAIFTVGGMGVLAINGFRELGTILIGISGISAPGLLAIAAALVAIGGISWKAFNETPDAWEALKDVWNELKTGILDSLLELIKSIGDALGLNIDNWEDVAWTIAWAASVAIAFIENIIDAITLLVRVTITAVDGFVEIGKAIFYIQSNQPLKLFSNTQRALADLKSDINDVTAAWDAGMSGSNTMELAQLGVEGFRQRYYFNNADQYQGQGTSIYAQGQSIGVEPTTLVEIYLDQNKISDAILQNVTRNV